MAHLVGKGVDDHGLVIREDHLKFVGSIMNHEFVWCLPVQLHRAIELGVRLHHQEMTTGPAQWLQHAREPVEALHHKRLELCVGHGLVWRRVRLQAHRLPQHRRRTDYRAASPQRGSE